MDSKSEYIRISDVNREEAARLLIKAKGNGRSMRQFADECGVNHSTFSRIANKMFKGASTEKLIRTIAEHADPESGITLDALMAANGMARIVDSATVCRISEMELEKRFKYVIFHELKKLDDLVEVFDNMRFNVTTSFRYESDIIVRSKLLESTSDLWAFDLLFEQRPVRGAENDGNNTTRVFARRILDRIGKIIPMFYCDEKSSKQVGKYSFVIMEKELFDYLKAEFTGYCVPFEMSFILFDLDRDVIEQEFILKQPGGYVSNSVFDGSFETDS